LSDLSYARIDLKKEPAVARVVVPDDSPPVITGTAAVERIRSAGDTVVFNSQPASEDDLIRRIEGAHTVVNIRGYCKFPLRVLEAVGGILRHLAVWGSGTNRQNQYLFRDTIQKLVQAEKLPTNDLS
jgi:hypothetical protein